MVKRAAKVCPCTGCPAHPGSCPAIVPGGRCGNCAREADAKRGRRQARGYGAGHDRLRRRLMPTVQQGHTNCARCGQPIQPGEQWALDHNDDRTGYLGPSHKRCNNQAGGRAAHER